MLEETPKRSNHVYDLGLQLQQQRLQQALELKQLKYKLKEEERTLKLKLQPRHQLQIKDLQVKTYHAKQEDYKIIKLTRAIDNQRSKTDIQGIYAVLNEAFDHFCKIHEQYHIIIISYHGKLCHYAKQKLFEIITKFTAAQDNQTSNTNILEIDTELNEAFEHFHKVHKEHHGLLDDEEDIEAILSGLKRSLLKQKERCKQNKDQAGCSLDHSGASRSWVITSEAAAEQSIVEPMTPKLNTSNPTATELITDESTDAKPTTIKSTSIEQTSLRTTSSEPIITKMTTIEPTTVVPTSSELPIVSTTTPKPTIVERTTTEPMYDESAAIGKINNESTSFELRTLLATTSEPNSTKITTIKPITIELTTEPTTGEPTTCKSIAVKCMSKKSARNYKDSDSSNKTTQQSWNTATESSTPEAEVEPTDKPPDNNDTRKIVPRHSYLCMT